MDDQRILPKLAQVEFFRHGFALVPDPRDKQPGIAFHVQDKKNGVDHWGCLCGAKGNCKHLKELSGIVGFIDKNKPKLLTHSEFLASPWHRIASILYSESSEIKMDDVRFEESTKQKVIGTIQLVDDRGLPLVEMVKGHPITERWLGRLGLVPKKLKSLSSRKAIECLQPLVYTPSEKEMNNCGVLTRKQDFEKTFWYRFAYHFYREIETPDLHFEAEIDKKSGIFWLKCKAIEDFPFRFAVPRPACKINTSSLITYPSH